MKLKMATLFALAFSFVALSAHAGTVLQNVQGKTLACGTVTNEGLEERLNFKVEGKTLTIFANTVKGMTDTKVAGQVPLTLKLSSVSDLITIAFFAAPTSNARSKRNGMTTIELQPTIGDLTQTQYEISIFGSNAKENYSAAMDFSQNLDCSVQ